MTTMPFVMNRRGLLAGVGAIAFLPACATAPAVADYPSVRALVDRYVAEKKVPNMVVAIGRRDGRPAFFCAGQLALESGPRAGPDSLFRIYSMSKPVTGCAIMILVEEGKLRLERPSQPSFRASPTWAF